MMRDGAENIDYGAVKMALDRVKAALTEALELISTWEGYSKVSLRAGQALAWAGAQ